MKAKSFDREANDFEYVVAACSRILLGALITTERKTESRLRACDNDFSIGSYLPQQYSSRLVFSVFYKNDNLCKKV